MGKDRGSDVIGVEDWNALAGAILLDTRSPGEFEAGQIPGAINVPLFDNVERAEIGTLYKQQGKSVAMERGLEIIGPRMADLVRQVRTLTDGRDEPVVVHCWRGGMRSNSVTWLLRTAGIPARRLDGGYKAYRRFVLAELGKLENLRILAGPTGSGKSPILRALAERGERVLDLEGLARHLGSAFGNLERHDQPTSEQFANDCFEVVRRWGRGDLIWLEDESRKIGTVHMPEPLYAALRNAPIVRLHRTIDERIDEIERIYGEASPERLKAAFHRIADKLGGLAVKEACAAIDAGDLRPAIRIGLHYYDKLYAHTVERHGRPLFAELDGAGKDFLGIAAELADL